MIFPGISLKSIPGLKFEEMYRIRAYAWCCGAGGGVKEAYPDFAVWTARERIREAKAVGAEAIVSACPTCKQNFQDALKESGDQSESPGCGRAGEGIDLKSHLRQECQ